MDLRLAPTALRIRLQADELQSLLAGQTLQENLPLAAGLHLCCTVQPTAPQGGPCAALAMTAQTTVGGLQLSLLVAPPILREYADGCARKDGIKDLLLLPDGRELLLVLEVDVGGKKKG